MEKTIEQILNYLIDFVIQNPSNSAFYFLSGLGIIMILLNLYIVPHQEQWTVERFGKFHRIIYPGLNIIVPFIDHIAYKHDIREKVIDIDPQMAITKDNVSLSIDGVIYIKVVDAKLASYGTTDYFESIIQLAKTSMRSAIGKMPLDHTFEAREDLNKTIVLSVNEAASPWGVRCLRYEIKDITVPANVKKAMEMQVAAERQKRADVLFSEGKMLSTINVAEGDRQKQELASQAEKIQKINYAEGEAQSIVLVATATAQGIEKMAKSIGVAQGSDAVALKIAEKYIEAFNKVAENANTVIVPANSSDASSMITQSLSIFKNIMGDEKKTTVKKTTAKKTQSKTEVE